MESAKYNRGGRSIALSESSLVDRHKLTTLVGIGASAGGLEALQNWFNHMPANTGAAFVVIQHLSPDFKTMMDMLLEKYTEMPIVIVEKMVKIEPNHIYIISPSKTLTVDGLFLIASQRKSGERFNQPINEFFFSLAVNNELRSIAVILSGTGSDGTLGIKSVYANGGLVLVQDPDDAQFDGMPMNAIATGVADMVEEISVLATTLARYLKAPENDGMTLPDRFEDHQDDMQILYSLLLEETGIDFSLYKLSTISRRLEHRMGLNQIGRLSDYNELLRKEGSEELKQLKQVLLINVTQFFRDIDSFKSVNEEVVKSLLLAKNANEVVRVWSIGCSTGEEPYSLAIMLYEMMEKLNINRKVKIFSTDVDEKNIHLAMQGSYPESIINEVPEYYIRNHFTVDASGFYRVSEHIRHMVVFACHDVLKDPPFSSIDLVVCRNVLIYFQMIGQQKVFKAIEFSLVNGGYLFLGKAETTIQGYENLKCTDFHDKVYRKDGKRVSTVNDFHEHSSNFINSQGKKGGSLSRYNTENVRKRLSATPVSDVQNKNVLLLHVTERLFDLHLPPTVIIDTDHEIIKSYGDLGPWMKPIKPGEDNKHIRDVFISSIANHIVSATDKVIKEEKTVNYEGIDKDDGSYTLNASPLKSDHVNTPLVIVVSFIWEAEASRKDENAIHIAIDDAVNDRIEIIEKELQLTRSNLSLSQRELDTVSAKLQTSNEELMASNEELQGTNEELQSVNEELHTLNSEYQQKINELTVVNNDLNNFMKSTEIAAIFLDRNLRIRRYTQPFTKYINILPVDINRSFLDLKMAFQFGEGEASFNRAISNGKSYSGQIEFDNDRYAIYKIIPYYDASKNIDGIVIIVNEDSEISAVMRNIKVIDHERFQVYRRNMLVNWTYDLSKKEFVFEFNNALDFPERIKKTAFYQLITSEYRKAVVEEFENLLSNGEEFQMDMELEWPKDITLNVHFMAFFQANNHGGAYRVSGIIQDVTKETKSFEDNRYLQNRFDFLFDNFLFAVSILNESFIFEYVNDAFCHISGYTRDELVGQHYQKIKPDEEVESGLKIMRGQLSGEDNISVARKLLHKNGEIYDVYVKTLKLPSASSHQSYICSILIPVDQPVTVDLGEGQLELSAKLL